jgi:hypothetical protein
METTDEKDRSDKSFALSFSSLLSVVDWLKSENTLASNARNRQK